MTAPAPLPLHHGAIGNGRVLALVGPDTSIDWLCLPRFDSPSVFARLLDQERGGTWAFKPVEDWRAVAGYVRNTNVLRTEVETADGVLEMYDFAPRLMQGLQGRCADRDVPAASAACRHAARARALRSASRLRARRRRSRRRGLRARSRRRADALLSRHQRAGAVRPGWLRDSHRSADVFFVQRRQAADRVLGAGSRERARADHSRLARLGEDHRAAVVRAGVGTAIGAVPQAARLQRHRRDHRRRDDQHSRSARLGPHVGLPLLLAARRRVRRRGAAPLEPPVRGRSVRALPSRDGRQRPLQPIYGITGKRDLHEEIVPKLRGYEGVGPVRIGNAAYVQRQHDVDGEMVLCLETILTDPRVVWEDPSLAPLLERLVDEAMASFDVVDTGLWEYRTLPQALHVLEGDVLGRRAARRRARRISRHARRGGAMVGVGGREAPIILDRAYNKELGLFTQAFDGHYPDASNLLLPSLGLIDPHDPRLRSTVRAYERLLAPNGLMLRYKHPDDFGDTTSAFSICSFWWVEALAMMGEVDEAVALFRRLEKYANPLGLFSEDIDPATGALLGNFPQAYTHVGLIHAAITIGEILDARHGSFRAWS